MHYIYVLGVFNPTIFRRHFHVNTLLKNDLLIAFNLDSQERFLEANTNFRSLSRAYYTNTMNDAGLELCYEWLLEGI